MPCGARCVRNILVDTTGAIVALLASLRGTDQLITTWPVVTECAFVLERHRTAFFDWLFESRVEVVDFDLQAVRSMLEWMKGYSIMSSLITSHALPGSGLEHRCLEGAGEVHRSARHDYRLGADFGADAAGKLAVRHHVETAGGAHRPRSEPQLAV